LSKWGTLNTYLYMFVFVIVSNARNERNKSIELGSYQYPNEDHTHCRFHLVTQYIGMLGSTYQMDDLVDRMIPQGKFLYHMICSSWPTYTCSTWDWGSEWKDQLHTRAKEFNWRDVTSGCSFARKVLQSRAKSAGGRFEACGWLNYTHHTI